MSLALLHTMPVVVGRRLYRTVRARRHWSDVKDSSCGGRRLVCSGRGRGRRGRWLWVDCDRNTATLIKVGVCEALPSRMPGRGDMTTSLRRDGTHVGGKSMATTAESTHTITTAIAAAEATRRTAGQECSMANSSTRPTCTAAVGSALARRAAGAMKRRAPPAKIE